jgi:ribosomal protein L33
MAGKKKGNRTWVWMVPEKKSESSYRFQTERNKVNEEGKLKMRRYDPTTKTHRMFVESR